MDKITEMTNNIAQNRPNKTGVKLSILSPLAGAVQRDAESLFDDFTNIRSFGAVCDGVHHKLSEYFDSLAAAQLHYVNVPITSLDQSIDSVAANQACYVLSQQGGGKLHYPGRPQFTEHVVLRTGVYHTGSGKSATIVEAVAGWNNDLFKTLDFDTLTGVGPMTVAPHSFGVTDMTLHGRYFAIDIFDLKLSWRNCDRISNAAGCGLRIFGSMFVIDVDAYNFAEHGAYLEGVGDQYPNRNTACTVKIEGRISGKEGVVLRGPGDSLYDLIVWGLSGMIPLTARKTTNMVYSTLYPGEPVDCIVMDNSNGYQGHGEVGTFHAYANCYGYGIRTRGVCRMNAKHLATDNCNGGYKFDDGVHGVISILESRSNSRYPDAYTGNTMPILNDIKIDAGSVFGLTIQTAKVSRYGASRDTVGAYAVTIEGDNHVIENLHYLGNYRADGQTYKTSLLSITGQNNRVGLDIKRMEGNAVFVSSAGNHISGTISQITGGTVLTRDASVGTAYANNIKLTATRLGADVTAFNAIGSAVSEDIELIASGTAGFTYFSGTEPDMVHRFQNWKIACHVGGSLSALKSTNRSGQVALGIAVDTEQMATITHGFLFKPSRYSVSHQVMQVGGTHTDGELAYCELFGDPTESTFTIRYKWKTVPTSVAVPALIWKVKL